MKEEETAQEREIFPIKEGEFSIAHRRWLVREISSGRMSVKEALERFEFKSKNPYHLVRDWCERYKPEISLTLPVMTEAEQLKQEALQRQIKQLKKELEEAQMKNIALETLIDVAEEQLKIPIRKKAGVKQ